MYEDPILNNKFIQKKGILNIYKHKLVSRKFDRNPFKNFVLISYFLFYRISLELGISMMTTYESGVFFIIIILMLFSFINQGSRLVFRAGKNLIHFILEIIWIYKNIEEIKKLKLDNFD